MKTPHDPRHVRRQKIVAELYSTLFRPAPKGKRGLVGAVLSNKKQVDKLIARSAPEWAVNKINRVDLAILRLAVWEIAIDRKIPPKVTIDEAVEIAKRYGSDGSPGFINGVLGAVFKKIEKGKI